MHFEFDRVRYAFAGKPYTLLLNKAAADNYTQSLRQSPRSEPFLYYILARAAQLGRTMKVADIGANVGGTVLPVAAHGIEVLAVEAMPANFVCLLAAARENGFRNVVPVNMAVYDAPGLVHLGGASAWAKVNMANARAPGMHTAAADTLVAILQSYNFDDVDLIKIDIEGAELAALTGSDAFFAERPGIDIVYECNSYTAPFFGHDQQALTRWFNERGFDTYSLNRDEVVPLSGKDATPRFLLDMLATKRPAEELQRLGWRIGMLSEKQLLESLLLEARNGHKMRVAHVRAQEPYLTPTMRSSPVWREIETLLSAAPAA